jgi:ribosomal protein S14
MKIFNYLNLYIKFNIKYVIFKFLNSLACLYTNNTNFFSVNYIKQINKKVGCLLTGRRRANIIYFGVSRLMLKKLIKEGFLVNIK